MPIAATRAARARLRSAMWEASIPAGARRNAWAEAVERLASDSFLRERLASRAHRDFRESYTWAKRGARVLEGLEVHVH